MRHSHLKSFQKSLPPKVSGCYLVLYNHDYERGQILELIASRAGAGVRRFRGSEGDWKGFWEALQGPSLFSPNSAVLLDELELMPAPMVKQLAGRLKECTLILGAREKSAFAAGVEQQGVLLDMSEEKPWDRDRRWAEQLMERAGMLGKILDPQALEGLMERIDPELALLEREVDKLACFVGARSHIALSDVKSLSVENRTYTLWRIAEAMVWERQPAPTGSDLYGLIPALRWNLQVGVSLYTAGSPAPKMAPKKLEQRRSQAAQLGLPFFQRGLDALFELELLSRSASIASDAALDLFQLKVNSIA
jgi:DNA polymerase-3 subunit delta